MRLAMLVMSLLAAAPSAAWAQTATVPAPAATVSGVAIINAGTYTAQSVSAPSRAGQLSPTGTVGTASNWHFVSDSTDVAGQVGTQFGIEFRIDGNPVGEGVTLHLVLNFPPQGIRNPNTGDMMHTANIAFPNLKIGRFACSATASTMPGKSCRGSGPNRSGIRTACWPSGPLR
jgi:hypothetical protein